MSTHFTSMPVRNSQGRAAPVRGRQKPVADDRNLDDDTRINWMAVQTIVLYGGIMLVGLLLFRPALGIAIMWNVLIPVAPVLVTVAPGLWRNICPMSTFSLLPRRLGLSLKLKMPASVAAVLGLISVVALFTIVPLRHICLNTNGPMTVVMLVSAASIAALMGLLFEWRSGWCTTLCPIHPVEKLYGTQPAITLKNARCDMCAQCTTPCPDSTPSMTPLITGPSKLQKAIGNFMVGSFFGFVLGWFQVPDYYGPIGNTEIIASYAYPWIGAAICYAVFKVLERAVGEDPQRRRILYRIFAAAAVSTYYWYRVPALTGFDPRSGQLINITHILPVWFPIASHIVTTSFFFWFLVIRQTTGVSWMKRPSFVPVARPVLTPPSAPARAPAPAYAHQAPQPMPPRGRAPARPPVYAGSRY
jgi:hypothetical protein